MGVGRLLNCVGVGGLLVCVEVGGLLVCVGAGRFDGACWVLVRVRRYSDIRWTVPMAVWALSKLFKSSLFRFVAISAV